MKTRLTDLSKGWRVHSHKRRMLAGPALFLYLIGFSPIGAAAQEHTASIDPVQDDIVTVYDTLARASSLPLSVDVLSQEDLENIRAIHPAEALNRVAGVNIHRGSGQEHLTAIRSPVLTGGAGAGSFLYLQDGVPLRAAGFANVNGLFEAGTEFAGSIDVIKGPGPATYGSNAIHGLINIQSRDLAPSEGRITIMGSDAGLVSLRGEAGLGLDGIGSVLSASASLVSDSGFRESSGFDQQKFQLRYDGRLGELWDIEWLSQFQNLNQETAGFIRGVDAYRDDHVRFTNPNSEAFRDAKSYRTQARIERAYGDAVLAITPYARRAELRFLRHFVPGQALEENSHSSIGLQTAYYSDAQGFNVGVDAEYTSGAVYEFQDGPSAFSFVQGLHYDYEVKASVIAGYAEKTISLENMVSGPALFLDIGARGEYTHYDYDTIAPAGTSGRFIRSEDRKDDFFTITPKASLRLEASNGLQIYGRAARGSRAPQITDLYSAQQNQVPGQADVETLDSLEAGFKYASGGASFEAAIFTMWKDNFFFRNADGDNVVNGKTRHKGAEVSFHLPLISWLSISGDATLARHEYDFTEPANNIAAGARVDTAPDTLGHLRASLMPGDGVSVEIEWRHVGRYFTDPGNTADYPGHDIYVLRGAYNISGNTKIFARVDNVFDQKYADRADFAFGQERYFPGRPRTLFFGLTQNF